MIPSLLSRLFDYTKGEVLISRQEIAEYMYLYQQWYAVAKISGEQLIEEHLKELEDALEEVLPGMENVLDATMTTLTLDSFNSTSDYIDFAYHWSTAGFPIYTDTLTGALQQAAIGRAMEKELEAHPLKTYDGKAVAEITYYGAVGAGSKNAALAYEYFDNYISMLNNSVFRLAFGNTLRFLAVLLLYLWKNTGYAVILLLSGLITISDDLYEAASLDGANKRHLLCYITIPQMWYSIFFATVFSLINAFKCFREIFLIGGIHPHNSIYMLQHFINNAFDKMNYPKLAVASVLMFIVITVFFSLFYRFVMRKEEYKE